MRGCEYNLLCLQKKIKKNTVTCWFKKKLLFLQPTFYYEQLIKDSLIFDAFLLTNRSSILKS